MVENPAVWATPHLSLCRVANRCTQVDSSSDRSASGRDVIPKGGNMMDIAVDYSYLCSYLIADKLKDEGEYRAAVRWADLALFHVFIFFGYWTQWNTICWLLNSQY